MATIKKADFARYVHKKFGFPMAVAENIVTVILDEIVTTIKRGEPVKITNFGTFNINYKRERMGRNPQNGKPAVISARKVPTFKSSADFKQRTKLRNKV